MSRCPSPALPALSRTAGAALAALALLCAPVAQAADKDRTRSTCDLSPTGGDVASDARDGRTLALTESRRAGLANWEVRWWRRHRVWITLSATNRAAAPATLLPEIVVDLEAGGAVAAAQVGDLQLLAPGATATQRLAYWVPDDARTLGLRVLATGQDVDLGLSFGLECSQARFDKGEMAAPAAALLDRATRLYLAEFIDPLPSSHDSLELVRTLATGAQDSADVVWVVQRLMRAVGDESSYVLAPGEAPPPAAARELVTRAPGFELRSDGIAVLRLYPTGFHGDAEALAWAGALHDGIAALAARRPRGWIVDLRQHDGADAWASLAGLSPLLAGPEVGAFVTRGERQAWIVERGSARVAGAPAPIDLQAPPEPPFNGPIAVLIGPNTSNVGGQVAVSFEGRPQTRFFGLPTAATASGAVHVHTLPGGTILGILDTRSADRTGRIHRSTIDPDERVASVVRLDTLPGEAIAWVLADHPQARAER